MRKHPSNNGGAKGGFLNLGEPIAVITGEVIRVDAGQYI